MVQLSPRGNHEVGVPEVEFAAIASGHDSAGLPDQEDAGGDIPGMDVSGPEGIERAAGNVSQIECRGAGTANRLADLHDLDEVEQVGRIALDAGRQAHGDEAEETLIVLLTFSRFPLHQAPWPAAAEKHSSRRGS